ncbi:MAG: ATP synthase subunit C [Wenzhouxiangellaceae bacterium]|nr:ATP synthase subunit C [Wenzhouxiangellaceae bacterium]
MSAVSTSRRFTPMLLLLGSIAVAVLASMLLWLPQAFGAEPGAAGTIPADAYKWGFAAAAAATAISALAAGYAVATVGSAGVAALTEKPELLGRVLILVGLAEGIAIYGLIVSILIINRLG